MGNCFFCHLQLAAVMTDQLILSKQDFLLPAPFHHGLYKLLNVLWIMYHEWNKINELINYCPSAVVIPGVVSVGRVDS